MGSQLDSTVLAVVGAATCVGTLCVWRILAAIIDHATRLHDTKVKVATLQMKYYDRAKSFRDQGSGGGEPEFVVGEIGEEPTAAAA